MRKLMCVVYGAAMLFIVCLATTGCSKNGEQENGKKEANTPKSSEAIVGKWKLVEHDDEALPNLGGFFTSPQKGTIFHFTKDKKLVITRKVLDFKTILPGVKEKNGGPGIGLEANGTYKVDGKEITITLRKNSQKAQIATLTKTDLVLTDKKKKTMKFKRQ